MNLLSKLGPFLRLGLAALVLGGCGTLAGTKQIISLDSTPRGAVVYDGETPGKPLGTTPLFVERSRRHVQQFSLKLDSGHVQPLDLRCGFRWTASALPNTLLAIGSVPLSVVGFGVDFATGAAFDCDDQVSVALKGEPPHPRRSYCRRLLIAPPQHLDEALSDRIALEWMRKIRARLGPSDSIVDYQTGKDLFAYLNVTNLSPFTVNSLDRQHLNYLGLHTRASDIVVLKYAVKPQAVNVDAHVYDLHSLTEDPVERGPVTLDDPAPFRDEENHKWYLYTLSWFPNALTYDGFFSVNVPGSSRGRPAVGINDHGGNRLGRFITSFSFTDVDHPLGFNAWDISYAAFPSFSTSYWDKDFNFEGQSPYELSVMYLLSQFNGGISFHTPLGAISASVGAGPAFVRASDSDGFRRNTFTVVTNAEAAYTAFFTQAWFIQISAQGFETDPSIVQTRRMRVVRWQESSLSLGYFLPDMRTYMRKAL